MANEEELYNQLLEKLHVTNDQPEFKPVQKVLDKQEKVFNGNLDNELELIKKENNSKIDHQLYIIAENIVFTFFSLDPDKFYAALERCNAWGMDLCMEEFIINYYLVIKNNNRLKEFILLYFQKIIKTVVMLIEKQLTSKINLQEFTTTDLESHQLKSDLTEIETSMKEALPKPVKPKIKKAKKIIKPAIEKPDQTEQMKQDILADLRAKNKIFEEI